jgi:hypothetical protein
VVVVATVRSQPAWLRLVSVVFPLVEPVTPTAQYLADRTVAVAVAPEEMVQMPRL